MASLNTPFVKKYKDGKLVNDFDTVYVSEHPNRKAMHRKVRRNNRNAEGFYLQEVYDKPQRILKERYITDHILEKAIRMGLSKKEALAKYGKNRYEVNLEAKVIKVIQHKRF